ncbi:delta-60 repeat domain-containing protein [Paraflavitalea sp. CAU 1676]|uniref:delta-60 repeat domain-containing protein n=1 Tax=Paraflavitalea sp. CAU 1676 TaxID=3032598 RepID=UPI0023DA6360|nr:delta-60 repeat domain-containing protein [Paraflavitalea sp. CAU 1676]MDF2192778.1 delta-60 repeat domain-containing protein [Paraflavitalea sp. CAU 1676]
MKTIYVLLALLLPGVPGIAQFLTRDMTFNNNDTTANSSTRCVALQADNKILFFGDNTYYNGPGTGGGVSISYGGRLNPDGTLDMSFKKITLDGRVDDIEVQQFDQKILIGGSFTTVNGVGRRGIARLNTDGSLDPTFDPLGGIGGTSSLGTVRVWAIEVKEPTTVSQRRIFIGGDFSEFNGKPMGCVVSLYLDGITDGKLDESYKPRVTMPGDMIYDMVYDKALDKLYIGGEFYEVDGIRKCRLARLNPNGTLDNSYQIGPTEWNRPHSSVTSLFLNSDGKLLAGGYFKQVNNVNRGGLARFNLDGTLDMGFNTGKGFSDGFSVYDQGTEVRSVKVMTDGSIIAGGNFTKFNDIPCGHIVKLDANGSVDASTTFGAGFNDCVFEVRLQKQPSGEEKIVAGGYFKTYQLEYQGAIMRLVAEMTLDGRQVNGKANPVRDGVSITWSANGIDPLSVVTIEKSVDGIHFNALNKNILSSYGGVSGQYAFKDASSTEGVVYYRILIEGKGGRVYSNLMRVNVSGSAVGSFMAYPNPVSNVLSLRSNLSKPTVCSIEMYDLKGALLRAWQRSIDAGVQVNQFDMPAIGSQPLVLRVRDRAGNVVMVSKLNHIP